MKYFSTLIYHLILTLESPINVILALIGTNYSLPFSISWLSFITYRRIMKEQQERVNWKNLKEKESEELAKKAFNLSNHG